MVSLHLERCLLYLSRFGDRQHTLDARFHHTSGKAPRKYIRFYFRTKSPLQKRPRSLSQGRGFSLSCFATLAAPVSQGPLSKKRLPVLPFVPFASSLFSLPCTASSSSRPLRNLPSLASAHRLKTEPPKTRILSTLGSLRNAFFVDQIAAKVMREYQPPTTAMAGAIS